LNPLSEEQLSIQKVQRRPEKKTREEGPTKKDAHPFDNLVKALFGKDGAQIVPELIEGAEVTSAENVELDRSKLKADLIYRGPYGLYKRQDAVYDFEIQTGPDSNLIYRLLLYLAALYEHYRCLIVCVIIYLFRCSVVKSPHIMQCDEDGEAILTVKFRVICLWEMDPEPIVAKHLLPFYIFLPAMNDPSVDLLKQALKEMAHHYNRAELGYRFTWFSYMLRRTDMVSDQDKEIIEGVIKMLYGYEEIIQDDPVIQNLLAQRELEGEARGEARGKIENMRESILSILNIRFSSTLAAKAQPAVMSMQDYEDLKRLHRQLLKADDEKSALLVLDLPDEQSHLGSSDLPDKS